MKRFEGKTVLVTGAGRGIGRAVAVAFAKEGANVVVNFAGREESAKETVAMCEEAGAKAICVKADVSKEEECKKLMEETHAAFGEVAILVNNAGITRDKLLIGLTEEDFMSVLEVNLKGTYLCTKLAVKDMMKKRCGRIINLSSVVGVHGNAGQSNYAASKAGVIGFTKSVAKEFASRGITVNAVAPGMIETDMTDAIPEAMHEAMLNQIPLKRIGTPEDIANGVLFLASDEASYITGQVITIDGGLMG